MRAPLYKLFGCYHSQLTTDLTISVDTPENMAAEAVNAVANYYSFLKLKLRKDAAKDIEIVKTVRDMVGNDIKLRLNANQGWRPKEAVRVIHKMEDMALEIELVEQPVIAKDFKGLKYVTDMSDESLFSPNDCFKLLEIRACDLINIKLMKTGGIYKALLINSIAEACGIKSMAGSMLEGMVAVTAAAHLAAAKKI